MEESKKIKLIDMCKKRQWYNTNSIGGNYSSDVNISRNNNKLSI